MLIAFCNVNATKLTCFIKVFEWWTVGAGGGIDVELDTKVKKNEISFTTVFNEI